AYVTVQTAAVTLLEREWPAPPEGPAVQYLSVDGAMVPLVGGVWAEVRTLALGEVVVREVQTHRDRERTVHAQDLSYFSRLTDHETFARLATVETQRRGTARAGVVCAVGDGAPWIQDFVNTHRPDAVRILDWPHALGYVAKVATAVYGRDTPAARTWLAHQRRALLEEDAGPVLVLTELRRLQTELAPVAEGAHPHLVWTVAAERTSGPTPAPLTGVLGQETAAQALEVVGDSLTYLEPRATQLCYAAFRAANYPLGSGSVESANKLLVEARLKGAGMHWERAHVNPLVALRTVAYGDCWADAWPHITTQQRHEARVASADRRMARAQVARAQVARAQVARAQVAQAQAQAQANQPETPPVAVCVTTPLTLKVSSRRASAASGDRTHRPHTPAADHPWRRGSLSRPRSA
ncbi:MAG: hypothetical protein LC769_11975, partial [Chloroflexi bacterium]|nr:hypothetical protein [Chloroflexota bacterium]